MEDHPVEEKPSELTLEAWKSQGRELAKVGSEHQFEVADWILAGDRQWGGSAYDEAENVTGYARKTLIEWAYVARNVSIRMDGLKFGHHQLVASMDPVEQECWLRKAADGKYSVALLRKQIKEERLKTAMPFSVPLTKEVYEKLQLLARASGISEQALALRAVTDLLTLSSDQVRARAEAERAAYVAKKHAEWEASARYYCQARARTAAMEILGKEQNAARLQYVEEKMADRRTEVMAARVLVEEAKQALALVEEQKEARIQALQPEEDNDLEVAVVNAEYEEAKTKTQATLDSAKADFEMVEQVFIEERSNAEAEAREKYPDPAQLEGKASNLKYKAKEARYAALSAVTYAENAAQLAAQKAKAAEELKLEAEQAEKEAAEAEATLEAQAGAVGAAASN